MPYGNNKGADHPVHPRSLISAFVVRCLGIVIPLVSISKISRFWLVPVAEQAGLSLTCHKLPKTGFLVTWLILYDMTVYDESSNKSILSSRLHKIATSFDKIKNFMISRINL